MKPIWIVLIIVVIVGVVVGVIMYNNKKKNTQVKTTVDNKIIGKKMSGKCFKNPQDYKDKMTTWLKSESGKNSDWGKAIQQKADEQGKSYNSMLDSELKWAINNSWIDAPDCEYIDKTVI